MNCIDYVLLKETIKAKNVNLDSLAKTIGTTVGNIKRIYWGASDPSLELIIKMSEALKLTREEIRQIFLSPLDKMSVTDILLYERARKDKNKKISDRQKIREAKAKQDQNTDK